MVADISGGLFAARMGGMGSATLDTQGPAGDGREDALAMRRLARGEIEALGELYDRHHAAVRRLATRMSGSADDGDDIVHATFLAALKNAASFEASRSCRAWLLGIAAHLIQRQRTKGARWARLLGSFQSGEPAWAHDPERALAAREGLSHVERALARLPEPKRLVLIMAELEGLAGEEIAHALSIPVGTVWTRLHHARRELSAALAAEQKS